MDLQQEIKILIIETLGLDDLTPDEIGSDEPLFGDGVGLDSIDALEIAVALEKKYNVKVPPDKETKELFFSIATLTKLVQSKMTN